jgi:cytochrome P450
MKHAYSDVIAFRRDPLTFLLDRGSNAGDEALTPLGLGPSPVFLVTDPTLVKPMLKLGEDFVDKGRLLRKLQPIVGWSSLILNGEEHRRRRGAIHKHLARGAAERLVPQMAAEIRAVAARLAKEDYFKPHAVTAPLAIRMMCIAVFGRQVLTRGDEVALVDAVNTVEDDVAKEIFRVFPLAPWTWWFRQRRQKQAKKAMSFVVDRVKERGAETSAMKSLEELQLSGDDLRDELLTLLLAGHHTTGSTAAWILYHLATEPGLAERVAAEAADATDDNGEIIPSRLKDLQYSQTLMREVLRLYPAGWWFSREVRKPMEFGGRKLTPGTSLLVSPWHFHRDHRFWDEPHAFRMDRTYNGDAYIPFGAGPRACVGMGVAMLELQLLALEIASSYVIDDVQPVPAPWPKASVTLLPPPMSMRIRPKGIPLPNYHAVAAE